MTLSARRNRVLPLTPTGAIMRVCDLFSGCGGLSQGFVDAGFDVVVAVEHWKAARETYALNFAHPVLDLDIGNVADVVSELAPLRADVVIGGPPCQEFSAAGSREEGKRAALTQSFAKVVGALRPKWFVLENVPEVEKSSSWRTARRTLHRAGYGISQCVLNAAYFNVPQSRKRFFAVGRLGEADHFLDSALETKLRATKMTVREHLGDKLGVEFYYRHPRNWGRKAVFSIDEPSATIRSTNRPVPPGYTAHATDAGDYRVARSLTPHERALIQTFPPTFRFAGFTYDQETMIANAVPVALAAHVARTIVAYETGLSPKTADIAFRSWLQTKHKFTQRSAGNIESRLRRVSRMLGASPKLVPAQEALAALRRRPAFRELSSSVRSQLKRALELRDEYRSATRRLG